MKNKKCHAYDPDIIEVADLFVHHCAENIIEMVHSSEYKSISEATEARSRIAVTVPEGSLSAAIRVGHAHFKILSCFNQVKRLKLVETSCHHFYQIQFCKCASVQGCKGASVRI